MCLNCSKETSNPKFCSRSCSVSYNNRKAPKRSLEGECKSCQTAISSSRMYCSNCNPAKRRDRSMTKGEIYANAKYQKSALIRQDARTVYFVSNKSQSCLLCGYDFHIDVCHVKPISSFPMEATLAEINHIDNLIALCRNHHWEFDHDGPASKLL